MTLEQIRARFALDEAGNLHRIGNRNKVKLGTTKRDGFVRIIFNGKAMQASHIVWALKTGEFPVGVICYIDGDRSNINAKNLELKSNEEAAARGAMKAVVNSKGEKFASITQAARAINRNARSLASAIKHGSMCAGVKWRYL